MNVQEFLRQRNVKFQSLPHSPTYDAQRLAGAVHVAGQMVAKTVLLRADGGFVLAVLPATHHVDLSRVEAALGADNADIASEQDCGRLFSDCELGALPPFGSQYGIKTLLDRSLLEDEEIVFEGNTHHEAIRVGRADYQTLEQPLVAEFAYHI